MTLDELRRIIPEDVPPWRIREIIWHHAWSPTARGYRGRRTMLAIRRHHRKPVRFGGRGWRDVGYNGVMLAPDGAIYMGRPLVKGGAHTINHNRSGIGIMLCLNGDRERLEDYPAMLESLVAVSALYCETHGLDQHDIYPHSKWSTKSCPGRNVNMANFREVMADRLGAEVMPPFVRLKLSDGSRYNWVEGLPLSNTGGSIVAIEDCELPLNGGVILDTGTELREVLESHAWEIAAWHGNHGPSGTVYARRAV